MFTIFKTFSFSASHKLNGLPEDHPCGRMHGHNYKVTFTFKQAVLGPVGFVVDYRELSVIKQWIDETIDHRTLNNIVDFNPTSELLAQYFFNRFKKEFPSLASVTINETEKTGATYEPYPIEHRRAPFTR